MKKTLERCGWSQNNGELYERYHDEEWGVPVHDDQKIFEFLLLESAQAGLSWATILKKRENYWKAFAGFDPNIVASFKAKDIERLMKDAGIVRNRLKIEAAVNNAQKFLEVQKEFGSFNDYIWGFVDGKPLQNKHDTMRSIPAQTNVSEKLSKDLKKRGFKFLGPVVCYAHMQATGMVNDHVISCFRYKELR